MPAYFVTATGTDIGKTFVTAGLVRNLGNAGAPVSAVKPVMSGFDTTKLEQSDAGVLLEALGEDVTIKAISRVSPWRFAAPLSPDMAAAREGRTIDFATLVDWCRKEIGRCETLFIEGVGGIMVPLDDGHTVLDWMIALKLPTILVAGSYLGTISHTLTALEVCRRAGLSVAVIVVNESKASPVRTEETMATLRRYAGEIPIVSVPRRVEEARATFAKVWSILKN